ncbi:MAG: type II toxin-antitoxin system HicB family antitoxin [Deltaproteobacteria bacterium]|jgi:antitoxin HicB|nr:type II toxin-antitoxin system HicB family antitoxin [Deltaproteobacteria bacterium]
MNIPKAKIELRPLTEEEGGGWLAEFPDLPGCMSDGETPEEALRNAVEAETAWRAAHQKWGKVKAEKPARLVARLPRSIHRDLRERANKEGVSINTMMVTLIAHGLGEISGNRQASEESFGVAHGQT